MSFGPKRTDLHGLFKKLVPDEKVMLNLAFAEAFEYGASASKLPGRNSPFESTIRRPNYFALNRKPITNGVELLRISQKPPKSAPVNKKAAKSTSLRIPNENRTAILSSRMDDYVRHRNRCAHFFQPPNSAKSRLSISTNR